MNVPNICTCTPRYLWLYPTQEIMLLVLQLPSIALHVIYAFSPIATHLIYVGACPIHLGEVYPFCYVCIVGTYPLPYHGITGTCCSCTHTSVILPLCCLLHYTHKVTSMQLPSDGTARHTHVRFTSGIYPSCYIFIVRTYPLP